MSEKRTITIEPFDVSVVEKPNGFEMHFHGQTEGRNRYVVKLKFERLWWVRHIVKRLASAVAARRSEVEDAEKALRGE